MVVRMRSTKSHRNNRRSHFALTSPALTVDAKGGNPHLRHRANLKTGQYRGRTVIDLSAKIEKKMKRDKQAQKEGR